jgi:hypothetical protein
MKPPCEERLLSSLKTLDYYKKSPRTNAVAYFVIYNKIKVLRHYRQIICSVGLKKFCLNRRKVRIIQNLISVVDKMTIDQRTGDQMTDDQMTTYKITSD